MADRWFDSYRGWWCALSGLLLILSFEPFSLGTCGWIALVPAWWVITRSERARRQPIRHGYLIGLIYFGGAFWWIGNVTVVGMIGLVLYLALYPAIWFLLVARLQGGRSSSGVAVLFRASGAAALWVMLEWWRSWFLTGFNWNELGISQSGSPVFRQLAAFGGVPFISFVLVVVNILWAEGLLAMAANLRERRVLRFSFPFAAGFLITTICFALGMHHLQRHRGEIPHPGLSYACVQPNIPQIVYDGVSEEKFRKTELDALRLQEQLSDQALLSKPDLLIWPEAITMYEVFGHPVLNRLVQRICSSFDGCFLLGSQATEMGRTKIYNCAYLFGPFGERFQVYRKTKLVLLGEYLPGANAWVRETIHMGLDMTPGPGPEKFTIEKPPVSLAPLICFEDTLASVGDSAAKLRPDFFVTITNDGWYWGWTAQWGVRQHLAHAVFRCVEHDRPMIRCANNGISCQIDQNGTVVDRLRDASGRDVDVSGIFVQRLPFYRPQPTLHESWGDWIILISSLISGMLGLRFFLRSRES